METERQKLIMEIIMLAVLVQENTDYCIFLDYSGHVDSIDVRIRESKKNWQNEVCESRITTKFQDYYHKDRSDHLASLKAKRDILKEILETHEIPTHEMEEHVEHIMNYHF